MAERLGRGEAARVEREKRVAAVMRENLRKRKAQERGREVDHPPDGAAVAGEAAVGGTDVGDEQDQGDQGTVRDL